MTVGLAKVVTLLVEVGAPVVLDASASGRRFVPITGGQVLGQFSGRVLAGGGDWQSVQPDGGLEIDAHYVLDIDGHGTVEVVSRGVRHAPPAITEALQKGQQVDPAAVYFRTAIRLRTACAGLLHVNNTIYVSVGRREPSRVSLDVFAIG
ncbi:MAG: DUF3237 family protein [Micropepsaceae bacterium]